jgi:tRNA threonylcarbamoyladenosine biosynthesis protein TsaB
LIILGLDTTSNVASVALRREGVTVAEEILETTDGHAQWIYQMIERVLEKGGITLHQVDCFASAVGPGSFTGVRICLAAAKGLADATGKPAAGISNLRALASFGTGDLRQPVIDARRGQIYTAGYNSLLELVSPEILMEGKVLSPVPPLAAAIALCAEMDGPDRWQDPAALDAHYVRRSDVDAQWHDTK